MSSLSERLANLRKQEQTNLARAKDARKKMRVLSMNLQNSVTRIGWQAVLNVLSRHDETLRAEIIAEARAIAKDREADLVEGLGEVLYPIAIPEHSEPEQPTVEYMHAGPTATKAALECKPSNTLSTPPDAAAGVSAFEGASVPERPWPGSRRVAPFGSPSTDPSREEQDATSE